MDDATMEELIRKYGTVTRGTRCHADILGGTLEGLVMKLHSGGGTGGGTGGGSGGGSGGGGGMDGGGVVEETVRTEKYKFARYTIRTMLIRPMLSKNYLLQHEGEEGESVNRIFNKDVNHVLNFDHVLSREAREDAEEFTNRYQELV
jgi:hypothetical protein